MPSKRRKESTECSCNSPARKSSHHNIAKYGSNIDRLFYDQYLPLREKKLLDKLMRTRAVYDDIRNRILTKSSSEMEGFADKKEYEVIHSLIDRVDRGDIPSPHAFGNILGYDCSCCNCGSSRILPQKSEVRLNITNRTNDNKINMPHKHKEQRRKKISYTSVKSEPCTCVYENKIENDDRYIKPSQHNTIYTEEYYKNEIPYKPPEHNVKDLSELAPKPEAASNIEPKVVGIFKRKVTKNHECKCITNTTSSPKKIGLATKTKKIRQSIRSSVTAIENVFRIRKDSIAIYRDKLRKKRELKAWTCDVNSCVSDECIPAECYEKIKRKHYHISSLETQPSTVVLPSNSKKIIKKSKPSKSKRNITCKCRASQLISTENTAALPIRYRRPSKPKIANLTPMRTPQSMPTYDRQSFCSSQKYPKIVLRKPPLNKKLERCFCTIHIMKQPKVPPKYIAKNNLVQKHPPKQPHQNTVALTKRSLKSNHQKNNYAKCECEVKQATNDNLDENQPVKDVNPPVLQYGINDCKTLSCVRKQEMKNRKVGSKLSLKKIYDTNMPREMAIIKSVPVTKTPAGNIQPRKLKLRKPVTKPEIPYAAKSKSSPNAPTRQVLKIGSSFRFDIEFYKNLPEQTEITKPEKSINLKQKNVKPKSSKSDTKPDHVDSKRKIRNKYPDESILEPFLKRCFCSFRSNRYAKQKGITNSSTKMSTNNNIMPNNYRNGSQSSMTTAVVNYVTQNYANLLPYECEPNFCTPGKCDPQVCLKRIQMRNLGRSRNAGTTSTFSPGRTSSTSTYSGTRSTSTSPRRHRRHQKLQGPGSSYTSTSGVSSKSDRIKLIEKSKSSPSAIKKGKSVVKIGSTISFNIEFYKDTSDAVDVQLEKNAQSVRDIKHNPAEGRHNRMRYRKVKLERKRANSQSTDKPRLSTRRVGGRRKYHNEGTQEKRNVDSKNIVTDPFLKRCFCTLKLQQRARAKVKQKKTNTTKADRYTNVSEIKSKSTQTRRAQIASPVDTSNLLPYECEPNFCTPGQCDPYVCLERIKKRNLLKRCFCTLKFQPQAKPLPKILPPERRSIGVLTKKQKQKDGHALLPYECEPGVCTPGSCDPYECIKLIDKRNKQDAMLQTKQTGRRSEFSTTSTNMRDEGHVAGTRTRDAGHSSRRVGKVRGSPSTVSRSIRAPRRDSKSNEGYSSSDNSHTSRQSVRIGSQLSFEIEFFKGGKSQEEKSFSKPVSSTYNGKHPRVRNNKFRDSFNSPQGFRISRDRGHAAKGLSTRDSQAGDMVRRAHKSSFTDSMMERCFCTLKLQKKGNLQQHYRVHTGALRPNLESQKQPLDSQCSLCARECRASRCLKKLQFTQKI